MARNPGGGGRGPRFEDEEAVPSPSRADQSPSARAEESDVEAPEIGGSVAVSDKAGVGSVADKVETSRSGADDEATGACSLDDGDLSVGISGVVERAIDVATIESGMSRGRRAVVGESTEEGTSRRGASRGRTAVEDIEERGASLDAEAATRGGSIPPEDDEDRFANGDNSIDNLKKKERVD